jgi:hypothetical protein
MTEFGSSFSGGTLGGGTGGFLKPNDLSSAYLILVEVKSFNPSAPGYDEGTTRSIAVANLTAFASPEALDKGEPSTTLQDVNIAQPYLAADLANSVGKAEVVSLAQRQNKKGLPSWVWRQVSPAAVGKVVEFVRDRDASPAAADDTADVNPWDVA